MNSGNRDKAQGSKPRPVRRAARGAILSLLVLMIPISSGFAQRMRPAPAPRVHEAPPVRPSQHNEEKNSGRRSGGNEMYRPGPSGGYQTNPALNTYRPGPGVAIRPGANGQHPGLQAWVARHQNLTPAQQEQQLRNEPGFRSLSPDQQRQVLDRFRTFAARPPAQQARTAGRLEMFQRLSPEQKQDVRSSAASLAAMQPDRRMLVGRAFNNLRTLPPDQRQEILNSARFSQQFSPEERHVLGSMLSIEPYQR